MVERDQLDRIRAHCRLRHLRHLDCPARLRIRLDRPAGQ